VPMVQEPRKNKVDVHSHFFAPAIWKGLERILGMPEKAPAFSRIKETKDHMQRFDVEQRMELMSQFGIEKSVFSFVNVPGYMGVKGEVERPEQRKEAARFLNDYFAEAHQRYPQRALFFADVPLVTDVDFSCRELHRAVEELGLQGVAIPSNIGGKFPSDPEFDDFFTEAERLGAPIFIHPQNPYGRERWQTAKYMALQVIGYPADASLTTAYMILDGFMERHQNIKIILTHLGGFVPYLYRRLNVFAEATDTDPLLSGKANLTKAPSKYLRHFYYDTAIGNPEALELCLRIVGADRILFGTDHPYIQKGEAKTIDYISRAKLTADERDKIYSENAKKLFGLR
jgi:predicted TIM-barrel fold metal-dependent hydrolase